MDDAKLEKFASSSRLKVYLNALTNDSVKVREIYCYNIKMSQAFYPILSILEVALRNTINDYLNIRFNTGNWLITQNRRKGYFRHPSLVSRRARLSQSINTSRQGLQNERKPVTHDNILASLPFYFWNTLFDNVHYSILKTRTHEPLDIFSNISAGITCPTVYNKIKRIRRFRNRIYHNEPICFNPSKQIDTSYAQDVKQNIYEILEWLDGDLSDWVGNFDNIDDIFQEIQDCLN